MACTHPTVHNKWPFKKVGLFHISFIEIVSSYIDSDIGFDRFGQTQNFEILFKTFPIFRSIQNIINNVFLEWMNLCDLMILQY